LSLVGKTENQLLLEEEWLNYIITQFDCGSIQIQTTQRDTLTSDQYGQCFLIPVDTAQPDDNFCLLKASEVYTKKSFNWMI
jgi:hypothetical protein